MKKLVMFLVFAMLAGAVFADGYDELHGYVVYDSASAGGTAFRIEPMEGGESIPVEGAGIDIGEEFFYNSGALVIAEGYFDGDIFMITDYYFEPDLGENYGGEFDPSIFFGAWMAEVEHPETYEWIHFSNLTFYEDESYESYSIQADDTIYGYWTVTEMGELLMEDEGGITNFYWEYFDEESIILIATYFEDPSGMEHDTSEIPPLLLTPMY